MVSTPLKAAKVSKSVKGKAAAAKRSFVSIFKPSAATARKELAAKLHSLAGVDAFDLPVSDIYNTLQTAGEDVHGACAVAQAGVGIAVTAKLSFNAAAFLLPGGFAKLGAKASLSKQRQTTSAIVLLRMAGGASGLGPAPEVLSLSMMEGVAWSGEMSASVFAGVGADVISVGETDLSASLGANASARLGYAAVRLVGDAPEFFQRGDRSALVDRVNAILEQDAKKACAAFMLAVADPAAAHPGGTVGEEAEALATDYVDALALEARDKIEAYAAKKAEALPFTAPLMNAAGFVMPDISQHQEAAYRKVWAFLTDKPGANSTQTLKASLLALESQITHLQSPLTPAEYLRQQAILGRIKELIIALDRRKAAKSLSKHKVGPAAKVSKTKLEKARAGSLTLAVMAYGAEAKLKGQAGATRSVETLKLAKTSLTSAKAGATVSGGVDAGAEGALEGNLLRFRFQCPTAAGPDHLFIQDTKANYFQASAKLAYDAHLAVSEIGGMDVDRSVGQGVAVSGISAGAGRFGSLTYAAASAYVKLPEVKAPAASAGLGADAARNAASGQGRKPIVLPGISGVSRGVSVQARLLGAMADALRAGPLKGRNLSASKWICAKLGIPASELETLLRDCMQPLVSPGQSLHPDTFPSDALLIEAGFEYGGSALYGGATDAHDMPEDLFHGLGYADKDGKRLAQNTLKLATLRLRYRVQSPLTPTSRPIMPLGLPLGGALPVDLGLDLKRSIDVQHEGIVDIYIRYMPQVAARGDSDAARLDKTLPPVILFNRGAS